LLLSRANVRFTQQNKVNYFSLTQFIEQTLYFCNTVVVFLIFFHSGGNPIFVLHYFLFLGAILSSTKDFSMYYFYYFNTF